MIGSQVYISLDCGLSLRDAAHEVLTCDSRQYEIRAVDGVYTILSRQQKAEIDLFTQVVSAGRMRGHHEAIPDSDYRAMQKVRIYRRKVS